MDGLIQNAGERFQRTFADEPLLERLRVCGTDQLSDPEVKKKCRELFRSWAQYAGTPGLDRIAKLHKVSCSLSCLIANADLFRNFLRGRLPQPKRDQRLLGKPRRTHLSMTSKKRLPKRLLKMQVVLPTTPRSATPSPHPCRARSLADQRIRRRTRQRGSESRSTSKKRRNR